MYRYQKAFLHNSGTVVLEKGVIKNAKETEFQEVVLIISADDVQQWHTELKEIDGGDQDATGGESDG